MAGYVMGQAGDDPDDRRPALSATRQAMRAIAEARKAATVTGPDGSRVETSSPTMTVQQQWELLMDARLADARAIAPNDPSDHRIITKREADELLKMPKDDGKGMTESAYKQALAEAAVRAKARYGKHAYRVLDEAIGFHLKDNNRAQNHKTILRKIATGETILPGDFIEAENLERLGKTSLSDAMDRMGRPEMARPQPIPGNPGLPGIFGPAGTVFNEVGPSPIPTNRPVATPTAAEIEWIRKKPGAWQAFDSEFGPGAAARALGTVEAGKPKDKMTKATGNVGKFSERKSSGWFGR
jgi:hypothetical protein